MPSSVGAMTWLRPLALASRQGVANPRTKADVSVAPNGCPRPDPLPTRASKGAVAFPTQCIAATHSIKIRCNRPRLCNLLTLRVSFEGNCGIGALSADGTQGLRLCSQHAPEHAHAVKPFCSTSPVRDRVALSKSAWQQASTGADLRDVGAGDEQMACPEVADGARVGHAARPDPQLAHAPQRVRRRAVT